MNTFFKPHIELLVKEGHQVDIACNYSELPLAELYRELHCNFFQIDFSRSPLSPDNIRAYGQLKQVVDAGKYDIVHCHTPNAAVITRLVCRSFRKRDGLRVFYTAHGFHFYKGAPKPNWLIFYPAEKLCSRWTDKLITINQEDHELAKNKFHASEIHYVPGVGIDLTRFQNVVVDRARKRKELGVPEDAFLLLSVGELNENKNHQVVINALAGLDDPSIHYVIAGTGEKKDALTELAQSLGLANRVHLLGYRRDVAELYRAADAYILPSIREGLNVSLMEAMAAKLPAACGAIRGNVDLIRSDPALLFEPLSVDGCKKSIERLLHADADALGEANHNTIQNFSQENVLSIMTDIYTSL